MISPAFGRFFQKSQAAQAIITMERWAASPAHVIQRMASIIFAEELPDRRAMAFRTAASCAAPRCSQITAMPSRTAASPSNRAGVKFGAELRRFLLINCP